jgi:hypothetical protein
MKIAEIFETRIEEKIEPVIKVGDVHDEARLASEIGSYVVTPTIERYVDEFLEHYTDSIRVDTTEIGAWISGYFGSGKSHLAKILSLIVENRTLLGVAAAERFEARVPPSGARHASIRRNLGRVGQCSSTVLAFNINSLSDSRTTPLPRLLLQQYYESRGYCTNALYAGVIEREMDRRGRLNDLHVAVERLVDRPWAEVRRNPAFYEKALYEAACRVAPEAFQSPDDVLRAIRNAQEGSLHNARHLVNTILEDLAERESRLRVPCRILFVLDESGQWIEDDAGRLAQLQALVEEAAIRGRGKIWLFVTTHEDMGSILLNARALQADMKKIEGRFRFRWPLTTENIEMVLEERLFRKKLEGGNAVGRAYDAASGVLRGLGELAGVEGRRLPTCERDRFISLYPFFPWQIQIIPEVIKSLRAKGGRGEQLSGSTRTLLAITQDVLRSGRRPYLGLEVGELVPFDEVYGNLSSEGEVNVDVRREISLIEEAVPGATSLTRRVAEVLYLAGEVPYVPRRVDNIARFLVESTADEIPALLSRVQPELDRLVAARMVARIGEEYEFLTGERRSFEDDVAARQVDIKHQELVAGFAKHFILDPEKKANHLQDLLGFDTVEYKGIEFPVRVTMDGVLAVRDGHVEVCIHSPLASLYGAKLADLEEKSQQPIEQNTVFVLCDRLSGFDVDLKRYLAMSEVVRAWKGDARRAEAARLLAEDRERSDLVKLAGHIKTKIREGIRLGRVIFRGSSRTVTERPGMTPGAALRSDLAAFWPSIYPKFDKVPVRIAREEKAILGVLDGERNLGSDVDLLKLTDRTGALEPHAPLLDEIRIFLATRQAADERTLGKDLLERFTRPPYGWDGNAIRVGVAACVRAGAIKLSIGKMPHTNPSDPALRKALRDSRDFARVELVLEDAEADPGTLESVRSLLMKLSGRRKIDETPADLHQAMEDLGREKLAAGRNVREWADAASFPLPEPFVDGLEAIEKVLSLTNPIHRIKEVLALSGELERGVEAIGALSAFHDRNRVSFTEMRALADQLRAIEHLFPEGGRAEAFLQNWETAKRERRFAESEVWKSLQTAKASARVEMETLISAWRDEAGAVARRRLDALPADLLRLGLPDGLTATLGAPLRGFLERLGQENAPARAAALLERARKLGRQLDDALDAEARKRQGGPPPEPASPSPVRPSARIRLLDAAGTRHVRSEAEWRDVMDRLDRAVRGALRTADVELD